jgi:transposase InsO family protein
VFKLFILQGGNGKEAGSLASHPKGSHTIHMDHLDPFIRSKKKNTQLLVIVDGFTKFEPVRSTKVKYVIRALEAIINIFEVPVRIITDRGSAFTSRFLRRFTRNMV